MAIVKITLLVVTCLGYATVDSAVTISFPMGMYE